MLGGIAIVGGLLLTACNTPSPPAPAPPPPPIVRESVPPSAADLALAAFVGRHREQAALAARQGRWADAIWHCDVLLALDSQDAAALAARAQAQAAAASAVAERLPRARQAWQRGDLGSARRLYLEVLVIAPDHAAAADALREIERSRVQRGNGSGTRANLAAPSRGTAPAATAKAEAAGATDTNDLEHASMLAAQGDVDAAIVLLEPLVNNGQAGAAARAQLADLYFRRAERLLASDKPGAIVAVEQCLYLQPGHRQAKALFKTLRAPETDHSVGAGGRSSTPAR